MALIVLILASCFGCSDRDGGGCSCFSRHYIKVEPLLPSSPPANQVNSSAGTDLWKNADNLGANKMSSGISSRNMMEESSSRTERRDNDYSK